MQSKDGGDIITGAPNLAHMTERHITATDHRFLTSGKADKSHGIA